MFGCTKHRLKASCKSDCRVTGAFGPGRVGAVSQKRHSIGGPRWETRLLEAVEACDGEQQNELVGGPINWTQGVQRMRESVALPSRREVADAGNISLIVQGEVSQSEGVCVVD